ncbi:MAG: response regulator [candidate division KSB1 bacterium]|nr:response regulator [candidate division KSB1 bacterium]
MMVNEDRKNDREPIKACTVLVGEADPFMRRTLVRVLEPQYRIKFAESGAELLELARRMKPDLIITEVLLRDRDGIQVCRELRADPNTSRTPILVFSFLELRDQALQAGADAFAKKPMRRTEFFSTVEELLRRRRRSEETNP